MSNFLYKHECYACNSFDEGYPYQVKTYIQTCEFNTITKSTDATILPFDDDSDFVVDLSRRLVTHCEDVASVVARNRADVCNLR